jgi:hypothetical protein
MREVEKSVYLVDVDFKNKTKADRETFMMTHRILANEKVFEMFDLADLFRARVAAENRRCKSQMLESINDDLQLL